MAQLRFENVAQRHQFKSDLPRDIRQIRTASRAEHAKFDFRFAHIHNPFRINRYQR